MASRSPKHEFRAHTQAVPTASGRRLPQSFSTYRIPTPPLTGADSFGLTPTPNHPDKSEMQSTYYAYISCSRFPLTTTPQGPFSSATQSWFLQCHVCGIALAVHDALFLSVLTAAVRAQTHPHGGINGAKGMKGDIQKRYNQSYYGNIVIMLSIIGGFVFYSGTRKL